MGKFHVQDGLYFERAESGSVVLTLPNGDAHHIEPNSWASVVAHVSAAGEKGETYRAALDFHGEN